MWVGMGEICSPLMSRLFRFVTLFGTEGGVLRRICRKSKTNRMTRLPGSKKHWDVTNEPIQYGGDHGWSNTVKTAFRLVVADWRIPEKGVCDVTPHLLRKLSATFMMNPFELGGLEARTLLIPVALGAAQLGSRDLDTFLKTYVQPSTALRIEACSRNQLGSGLCLGQDAARAPAKRRCIPSFMRSSTDSASTTTGGTAGRRSGVDP